MVKSGLVLGVISFVVVLGFSVLLTPFCAPCLGLVLGLIAGYAACLSDKPVSSGDSVRKGAIAGAIAGALSLVGGLIGGIINGALLNPSSVESFSRFFGFNNFTISQTQIWTYQLIFAVCIGLFNVLWMALMGIAGGALWFQMTGKNRPGNVVLPPQEPLPPSL